MTVRSPFLLGVCIEHLEVLRDVDIYTFDIEILGEVTMFRFETSGTFRPSRMFDVTGSTLCCVLFRNGGLEAGIDTGL